MFIQKPASRQVPRKFFELKNLALTARLVQQHPFVCRKSYSMHAEATETILTFSILDLINKSGL